VGRALIAAATLAALLVGAALLLAMRFELVATRPGGLYLFDRWTGALEFCTPQSCQAVPRRWQDAPFVH
jgi:hypothetical protein